MTAGCRILKVKDVQTLRDAYNFSLLYLALFGAIIDAIASLEGDAASVSNVIPIATRAIVVGRANAEKVGLAEEMQVVAECLTERLVQGRSGRIRVAASALTLLGRSDIRREFASHEAADNGSIVLGTRMLSGY